jgi:hypothetical protein
VISGRRKRTVEYVRFMRMLAPESGSRHERELERASRRARKRREYNERRRFARLNPALYAQTRNADMRPELRREPKPAAEPARGRLMRPIRLP